MVLFNKNIFNNKLFNTGKETIVNLGRRIRGRVVKQEPKEFKVSIPIKGTVSYKTWIEYFKLIFDDDPELVTSLKKYLS